MQKKSLNVFLLTGIFTSTILSVRNWPLNAEYGLSSIVFILLGALLFLVPVALASAELATGWPSKGGVYVWIREAFGERIGMLTSWFIWISNVIWYPTILGFIGSSIAYMFSPELAQNKLFISSVIVGIFWLMISINLKGTEISGWLSTICLILGTIVPGVFIIAFGIEWLLQGKELQISLNAKNIVPKFGSIGDLVFFAGILLGFSGMEMPAAHANEVKNPQRDYPKSILFSCILIVVLSILGTFSVVLVIPQEKISFMSASLDVISLYLVEKNMQWAIPIMALFLTVGAIGSVCTWIAGPSKTLLEAAQSYDLPRWVTAENKKGIPIGILIFQGGIVSVLSLLFYFMPSLNIAFWVLTALASQFYLIAYILLFAAVIYLRYKMPNVERSFRISKSKIGVWTVGVIGTVVSLFVFWIGFFPPTQIPSGNRNLYFLLTILGIVILGIIPLALRQKETQLAQKSD